MGKWLYTRVYEGAVESNKNSHCSSCGAGSGDVDFDLIPGVGYRVSISHEMF